jgi:hypothetical protein
MRILSAILGLIFLAFVLASLVGRPLGVEAGTAIRLGVPELVESSDLILEARVLSAYSFEDRGRIETEYLLEVARTFEGVDEAYRAVRLPGGLLEDGRGMVLAGMPRIFAGEEVLLFLTPEGRTGVRMPVGLSQGKLGLISRADGTKALARDSSGIALVNPDSGRVMRGQGVTVLDYAEVVAEIEAALSGKRDR